MRFFEKLDEDNGSQNVGVYHEVVSLNAYKTHGHVTIGVSKDTAQELALNVNNKCAILLIIDKDEFDKLI